MAQRLELLAHTTRSWVRVPLGKFTHPSWWIPTPFRMLFYPFSCFGNPSVPSPLPPMTHTLVHTCTQTYTHMLLAYTPTTHPNTHFTLPHPNIHNRYAPFGRTHMHPAPHTSPLGLPSPKTWLAGGIGASSAAQEGIEILGILEILQMS